MGNSRAGLATVPFLVLEPSSSAIEHSDAHQLRVELSGARVLVDGRDIGSEPLREALAKRTHGAKTSRSWQRSTQTKTPCEESSER